MLQWWPVLAIAVLVVVYGGFAGAIWWAQAGAHATGRRAMREFPGNEVEALVALVQSETHPLAERNHAVYALGQIGDERSLPVLAKFYSGRPCDHARFLCQRELEKAIDRCIGRNRPPRWLPFLPHSA